MKRAFWGSALLATGIMITGCVHGPSKNVEGREESPPIIMFFSFDIQSEIDIINEANGAIAVTVPFGTDLSSLSPTIEHTGLDVEPAPKKSTDFSNPVVYTVAAADGSKRRYTVTVTASEPSGNADLGTLTVSEGLLEPAFSASRTFYTVAVPHDVERLWVSASPANIYSTVENPDRTVELTFGRTIVLFTVTAQDGTEKEYMLAIDRDSSGSPSSHEGESSGTRDAIPSAPVRTSASKAIDHTVADLSIFRGIPQSAIESAKRKLRIAYGHTSHGSQIITGMTGLAGWPNALGGVRYAWSEGGGTGILDLDDYFVEGDLGNPDRVTWASRTREYLNRNSDVNVVMWSWCGQVSSASDADIVLYLDQMARLERAFPGVAFVYMTGHLDGTGSRGNLHRRNEQIRAWCRENGKWLYDFADIERYDPDGVDYLDRMADDGCYYIPVGGAARTANWALEWQNRHDSGTDWFPCPAAHTQPLNANLKAYVAWYLFARIAGWDGD